MDAFLGFQHCLNYTKLDIVRVSSVVELQKKNHGFHGWGIQAFTTSPNLYEHRS